MTTTPTSTFKFAEGEMVTVNETATQFVGVQGQVTIQGEPYTVRLFNADQTVITFKQGQLNSRYASTPHGMKNRERDLLDYQATKIMAQSSKLTAELANDDKLSELQMCLQQAKDNGILLDQINAVVKEIYPAPA